MSGGWNRANDPAPATPPALTGDLAGTDNPAANGIPAADPPKVDDDGDIRDGVRRAHGFLLTDASIVEAVDTTIGLADQVLRAAAAAAAQREPAPGKPPAPMVAPVRPVVLGQRAVVPVTRPARVFIRGTRDTREPTLTFGHIGFAVAASAVIAVVVAGYPWPTWHRATRPTAPTMAATQLPGPAAAAAPAPLPAGAPAPVVPQLVVMKAELGNADQALPLGLSVDHAEPGAALLVSGLAPGASLSAGQPLGQVEWSLSAAELAGVSVQPPSGFTGTMELVVELRLADGRVVERRSRRLEWARMAAVEKPAPLPVAPAPGPAPAPAAETRTAEIPGFTPRKLDPDEIAGLIKRGEELFMVGDISSARLMLQRAAEGSDARAALELAATYDPIVLNQLGARGVVPNLALARAWYEKAKSFGSPDAPRRLEMLASH